MLSINRVIKVFNPGSINERLALDNLSLQIESGDVVSIIGSNGAGKSTLLNVISGMFPISKGEITIDSEPIHTLSEHARASFIGRVFQDPMMGTAASMTVEENLAMAVRRGRHRGLRRGINTADRKKFYEILPEVGLGLENRLQTRVGLLSGGQRQALTLIMATIIPPRLLLLDEHTSALDPNTARVVQDLTEKLIKMHSLTTMIVTHNMEEALRFGNRTIMMHNGQIILDLAGRERQNTTVSDLLARFKNLSGTAINDDRMLMVN